MGTLLMAWYDKGSTSQLLEKQSFIDPTTIVGAITSVALISIFTVAALTMGSLALQGKMTMTGASIGALIVGGPVAFIPGIMGLAGATTLKVVGIAMILGGGLNLALVGSMSVFGSSILSIVLCAQDE